jgi:hypothetical protein
MLFHHCHHLKPSCGKAYKKGILIGIWLSLQYFKKIGRKINEIAQKQKVGFRQQN